MASDDQLVQSVLQSGRCRLRYLKIQLWWGAGGGGSRKTARKVMLQSSQFHRQTMAILPCGVPTGAGGQQKLKKRHITFTKDPEWEAVEQMAKSIHNAKTDKDSHTPVTRKDRKLNSEDVQHRNLPEVTSFLKSVRKQWTVH